MESFREAFGAKSEVKRGLSGTLKTGRSSCSLSALPALSRERRGSAEIQQGYTECAYAAISGVDFANGDTGMLLKHDKREKEICV